MRLVEKDGESGSLETFESIVRLNAVKSFNALQLAASRMAKHDPLGNGEHGVCILTVAIAASDGEFDQIPYATEKPVSWA